MLLAILGLTVTWVDAIKAAGEVATGVVGIWGFIKYIIRPTKKAWAKSREFCHNVNYAATEMRPNGGTSLKDSVEGLKHSIDAILSTVIRIDQKQIALANHSEKGIFEADLNGDTIFVNRAYCRMIGRTADEIIGKGWKTSVHPDDRDEVSEEWYSCVKERRDFVKTYRMLRPDNSVVTVDAHAYLLKDLKGATIGFMGFIVPSGSKNLSLH
jgi:PAS domain S-box-containing protein